MESLAVGIDKILWFIYRIFFILFPSFLFFIFSCFILYSYSEQRDFIFNLIKNIFNQSPFLMALVVLCICFTSNFIIDALGEQYLSFDKPIGDNIEKYKIFQKFNNYLQSDFQKKLAVTEPLTARELSFIARMGALQNNIPLNSYYWIIFCNYKIAISFALYLLLGVLLYSPIIMGINDQNVAIIYAIQSVTFIVVIWGTEKIISSKQTIGANHFLNRRLIIEPITAGILLVLGLFLISIGYYWGVSLVCTVPFFLLVQFGYGQREYSRKIPLIGYISLHLENNTKNSDMKINSNLASQKND